jgi:hypothetical protein
LRSERDAGLDDRSSAPKRIPHRTPAERVELTTALRRVRMTTAEISEALGMALSRRYLVWLKRIGLLVVDTDPQLAVTRQLGIELRSSA